MRNEHLYYCNILNEGKIVKGKHELIFKGNITEQKKIKDILENNIKKHKEITLAQEV